MERFACSHITVGMLLARYDSALVTENRREFEREQDVSQITCGCRVVAKYDGKEYPGEVTAKGDGNVKVNVMRQTFTGAWK